MAIYSHITFSLKFNDLLLDLFSILFFFFLFEPFVQLFQYIFTASRFPEYEVKEGEGLICDEGDSHAGIKTPI